MNLPFARFLRLALALLFLATAGLGGAARADSLCAGLPDAMAAGEATAATAPHGHAGHGGPAAHGSHAAHEEHQGHGHGAMNQPVIGADHHAPAGHGTPADHGAICHGAAGCPGCVTAAEASIPAPCVSIIVFRPMAESGTSAVPEHSLRPPELSRA